MRRPVVAVVAVVLALLMVFAVSGCGGGGEPADDSTEAPGSDGSAPAAQQADTVETDKLSPEEPNVFEPFPTDQNALPDAIAQRLESKQPMLLFLYDKTQKVSDDQRAVIDGVLEDYRGLIDLVSYDVGTYVSTDASGVIEVSEDMTGDEDAQRVARLISAAYLDVSFTPYIVFIDDQGYIIDRMRGYVDEKSLEREVLRATD